MSKTPRAGSVLGRAGQGRAGQGNCDSLAACRKTVCGGRADQRPFPACPEPVEGLSFSSGTKPRATFRRAQSGRILGKAARAGRHGLRGKQALNGSRKGAKVAKVPCAECETALDAIIAAAEGKTPAAVGLTTARPPYQPVSLGAMAGLRLSPLRRTAMDEWHVAQGAQWMRFEALFRGRSLDDPDDDDDAIEKLEKFSKGASVIKSLMSKSA